MAESPGSKRKSYFPTREDLAGYNRQLAEDLGGITDPSTFGAFTLFPEQDGQHQETPGFVWQSSAHGNVHSPPGVDFDPRPTFLPRYEDFVTNTQAPGSSIVNDPLGDSIYQTHNGYSSHFLENPDLANVIGVGEASQQGLDIYSKALEDWNSPSFSSTYSPFGTKEVLSYALASDKGESSTKPSYSEVARSMRALNAQSAKIDAEHTKKKSPECLLKAGRPHPRKSFPKPHFVGKGRSGSIETPNIAVHPDSKYGLDQFEDPAILKKGPSSLPDKTSSAESIPLLSRQESTSSVSSGTSGIEEIVMSAKAPLPSSSHMPLTTSSPPEVIGIGATTEASTNKGKSVKTSPVPGLDKSSTSGEYTTSASKSAPKPFFDPKRIFQRRECNATNQCKKAAQAGGSNSTSAGSGAGTLLNNGKLGYSTKSPTATHKPRTSDYINNDLRDTKKKKVPTATLR